jgi:hypothetical protein
MRPLATIMFLCLLTGLVVWAQDEEDLVNRIHAHVLARQLGPYDFGMVGDGAASQTLLVQMSDASKQEKRKFQKLAIIRYEFFPPGDSGIPNSTNDYRLIWEFDGIRTASCDQSVEQLYYGNVEKVPDPKTHLKILRVNRGAEGFVPKPSSAGLPCFLVHQGKLHTAP